MRVKGDSNKLEMQRQAKGDVEAQTEREVPPPANAWERQQLMQEEGYVQSPRRTGLCSGHSENERDEGGEGEVKF